jgi:hypothetical protein
MDANRSHKPNGPQPRRGDITVAEAGSFLRDHVIREWWKMGGVGSSQRNYEDDPEKGREELTYELKVLERSWRLGVYPALIEAVEFCGIHSEPLPSWVVGALSKELRNTHNGKRPKGVPAKKTLRTWIGVWRYFAVAEVLLQKQTLSNHGIKLRWANDELFEAISFALKGTPAAGTAGAIRKSYEQFKTRKETTLLIGMLEPPDYGKK